MTASVVKLHPLRVVGGEPTAKLVPLRREGVHLDELSDQGLIAACATADRGARAALFARHVTGVHRFIARMTAADADAVDDLVQSTFLEAFRCAARFRGGSQVRTWLFAIATNLVRTYARGEIRRKAAMTAAAELPARTCGAQVAEHRVMVERLAIAVDELPHDLREVFVLVDVEEWKGAEAAVALGVPEGTVWRRLHDARNRLRAALGETR
jgi:RNA polymerase sigma-70 factor (ECF subfamily)